MSFGPQVVMPGAFHFESPNGGSLSGVHPGIFRPPISPSPTSSLYLGGSAGNMYSDTPNQLSNIKRKRHRPTESKSTNYWSTGAGDYATEKFDDEKSFEQRGRQYVLAGQIETPNGRTADDIREAMEASVYSDVDYRRGGLGPEHPRVEVESLNSNYQTAIPSAPALIRQKNGWGSVALNKIGGVVGKVFEFCTGGVFRGFYAGGGKGYDMRAPCTPSQQPSLNGQAWCNEHDVPTLPDFGTCATPGGFQREYTPSHFGRGTPESTPPPAAKRRQINDSRGDELRSWVVVQEPVERSRPQSRASVAPTGYTSKQQSHPPVLRRRISKPVSRVNSPSLAQQQSSRISHAGTATISRQESASFASPRSRSPAPSYAPSRIPIPVPSRPQSPNVSPSRLTHQSSLIASPNVHRGHRRNHSTASAASVASGRVKRRESLQDFEDNSPRLDAEAKKLAAKKMQAEIQTDLRMNDFNSRLQAMIRQGKEALGTTIEVEIDDEVGIDPWEDE